jgi:hypothetical protein
MHRQECQAGNEQRSRDENQLSDGAMVLETVLPDQDELAQQQQQPGNAGADVQVW